MIRWCRKLNNELDKKEIFKFQIIIVVISTVLILSTGYVINQINEKDELVPLDYKEERVEKIDGSQKTTC